ncbi:MAG: hypothetical protein P4L69_13780, partial [Desulfosporosinus sp.]|nr:hypothetical protein [Desulfosporosinus sp.]
NASYTVPTDASGTVKAVFTSTASSQQTFNVVAEAPFSNNGQPVQSDEVSIEWGVPGSLVLSPIYSAGSPDSLNFSTSSATTKGLVPVVATLLPAATSTTDTTATTTAVSGQSVKFTMTTALPNTSTAFYTNSTGTTMVAQGAYVGSGVSSANYVATTDANGQALIYINANQPTTNSVANTSSNIKIGLQAQLVNGGGSTNTGYYQWKSISQPAKIANVSPAAMLNVTGVTQTNTVVATNAETATSGSQLTISGTVQDSAGNPVPNASIAIQDYNVADTNAYSNNVQNDAYVLNGTTTLFSAVNYPIVTTDSSGNYSVNVTANVPVTQSVYNSVTRYYAFYVPPTIAVSSGQSLPSTVTKLDYVGNGNPDGSINLVWQQGQTAQSVGVSHTSLSAQYSTLSDVPQTYPFSNVVGSDQLIYAAAFNQNGTIVAPASGNQFDGYDLEYDLTAPSGIEFETLGSAYLPSGVTEIKAHYNQYDNGTNPKLIVDHMYVNGTEIALPTTDAKTGNAIDYSSAYDGSGQLNFYLNSNPSSVTTTSGTAGSVNVNIAVYSNTSAAGVIDANHAQGSASGTVNATFGASNTITSIGVAGDMSGFNAYGPLLEGNAAPDSTTSVAGTASDDWTSSNASLVVAPFNSYPAISTVPSQGLTMNLSSDKTGLFRYVDGYQLATKPSNVSVNVNSLGEVSVNNYKLWTATGGYRVVGYATNVAADGSTSGTSNITLVEQSIAAPTTFIVHTVGGAATTVTIPSAYLPGNFEGYLGFKTDATTGALQPLVASYYANSKTNQFAPGSGTTSFLGMTFAPVVAATVQVSDKYSETPTVTVTNSVNSQTAKATVAFTSQNTGVVAIKKNPTSANGVAGVGQNMTLTALDTYGNAVPNQTLYLSTNLTGLWITAVNGTTITSSVNMGNTGSTSMQNENTPVPLFVYSAENPDLAKPAYDTVSVSGIMAYHLSSAPVVQLQTGTDGTVSITLQDGAVAYPILVGDQAGSRDIGVDPGRKIPSGTTMTVTNSSGTVIGNIPITWAGITESN